jgi:hypothetical protein
MVSALNSVRASLQRRFSPSRYLRRSDGLRLLSEGGAGSEWVVSRGLCAYAVFDCPALPIKRRRTYLATTVRRWAPFADPEFHAEWSGQRAMVWAWSAGALRALPEQAAAEPPRRLIPESLLVGAAASQGAQLVALEEGFEGRVWRDGVLSASRWWREAPDAAEWAGFLRGAGLLAGSVPPEPVVGALRPEGWSLSASSTFSGVARRYQRVAMAAGVGLLAFMLVVPLTGIARLAWASSSVRAQIAAQDESLQQIMSAREQAERDADVVAALMALRPPATQISLISTVVGLLPGEATLLEWRMSSPEVLEVVVSHPRPDPLALVQSWEGAGAFRDVTAELGRSANEVTIRGRLRPVATPGTTP